MKDIQLRTLFRETEKYADQEIVVHGWVRTNRGSNKFGFIELNDGTFFKSVQVVYEAEFIDNFEEIAKVPVAAALKVKGDFVLTPNAKQPFEIKAKEVVVEADSASDYPLQKKRHSMEFLREIAHLRPRSNTFSAVFRIRSLVSYAIHKFFQENDFVYVHTPIVTGSDCEGAGEMFRITTLDMDNPPRMENDSIDYSQDFFGKETSLTVSGQLEAETFALAFRNVYTFGPTFRAENSNTARHASEFWMIEPEVAFADLSDNMDLAEAMIKYIIQYVLEHAPEEMEFFNKFMDKGLLDRLTALVNAEFARVTYTEAVELLKKSGKKFEYPVEWGIDLQTEHERYLTEEIYKKPVFVTDYPKEIKAFYMRLNDDNKTVAACDLLVPGVGEIIGGSQREERYDVLKARMDELGLDEKDYWWYMDLRRYGGVKHAGYGLGLERIIMYLTGMGNIRDVLPFPRTPKTAEF
ncbi:asparagine--tRNA ligase [Ihubacter massiliensis]|uniref:Asparagine--tRNA ligase n=1 Tax=Hominibacterium faecale TaxID=2839743 RepID=A0A9J6QNJ0_9FIRM|nr:MULTISPECIES: asparagine--tRNA ligase [Eubacteriales Family XIII. Incertae Sedis]MCI7300636.1 asparagine--tRNA ligase [Clostridia bacterium]MCO7122714.1 asparagine--tRNA ligase [Ihubacter massiliensis]MCU7376988.1 asparagine--tRNA ligase [Hominibacterium faecale]MDY3010866.1 asparagine--tRNA ligase [Clostridiales Family XIII bacterium]